MFRENLNKIVQRNDLTEAEMSAMILDIFSGEITDAQVGAFMAALATKGETFEELAGAAKSMRIRDRWIGWTENQRLRNLGWVINNTRFLILPWVKIRYLASHVLGQITKSIRIDWQERWDYEPVLMETFVDPQRYEGSCYKASNWKHLGMTTGEGLPRKGKNYTTTQKMIFVKPLVKNFREVLCSKAKK